MRCSICLFVIILSTLGCGSLAAEVLLRPGEEQAFSAVVYDQFGDPMSVQPVVTWDASAAGGTLTTDVGAMVTYTAGSTPGDFELVATSAGLRATVNLKVQVVTMLRAIIVNNLPGFVWTIDPSGGLPPEVSDNETTFRELDGQAAHRLTPSPSIKN